MPVNLGSTREHLPPAARSGIDFLRCARGGTVWAVYFRAGWTRPLRVREYHTCKSM